MRKIFTKKKNGYAILELLFYIAFFAVLSILVINSMMVMMRSFRENALQAELLQGGSIMERMSREIRQATDINSISSSQLKLDTKDESGNDKTVEFSLSGSNIQLLENNVFTANLNTPNIVTTDLSFTQITTAKGKAVKIIFSIYSANDTQARVYDFYDTVVLRGSY